MSLIVIKILLRRSYVIDLTTNRQNVFKVGLIGMNNSSSAACALLKCFEMFKEHCRSIESQQNKALSDITGSVAFARSTDTSAFDDT